ncbi:hypothetical protein [Hymenobacter perfusus]|uniref:Uncharacterized protein n=1 Tax=Hymenobacter perfusus TaxID=1236770 RepID=A0A3R9MFL6_9BACT|nr:hypothetical protein [Hymenobacter perfusus]RSK44755.1 hypothetical protein EI293_09605 [Hymenobacter perfusus]
MKLEFLNDISAGGEFNGVVTDQLIRLYDFDQNEACQFRDNIIRKIMLDAAPISLASMDFIHSINCRLTLEVTPESIGIISADNYQFFCRLTKGEYENMIRLLEPFCAGNLDAYQWLYDIDTPIEFLFSPGGGW